MRIAVLVLLAVAAACAPGSDGGPPRAAGVAVVVRPIDGDTIEVELAGSHERVRLIGIDTPESVAQDRPVECFGPEAKARMAELLPPGTEVRLERDVEARDRYDRLLAYVFRVRDGVHVNLLLVEEGFAESSAYPPNLARQGELDEAEREAKAAGSGLWPVCGSTNVPLASR